MSCAAEQGGDVSAAQAGGSGTALTPEAAAIPLVALPRGQAAWVVALSGDGGLRHRLQALGLQPGQRLQVLRRAPWDGPIHLQVGMTELMLRRRDAARVTVALAEPRP